MVVEFLILDCGGELGFLLKKMVLFKNQDKLGIISQLKSLPPAKWGWVYKSYAGFHLVFT